MRAAIYARVSTQDQTCENQLRELRAYCQARGLTATEFVDAGVSGAKESRPALDALLREAKPRKFDLLIVWKLDRLGRSLRHLILTLDELHALGVGFVSLTEALDTTTPAGRFRMQILGAVAEFERGMIRERVVTGLARAKAQGVRLGRRRTTPLPAGAPRGLTVRQAAKLWGCSKSTAARRLERGELPARPAA
jgi:DNA invertase Pin-like site-specific DNA recombinase